MEGRRLRLTIEGSYIMPRTTTAERKRQEAEAHDRTLHAALAWPQEPCPQPFTKAEMDRLTGEMLSAPVPAWTFNAYSKRVSLGCFSSIHYSTDNATKTTTQTQGGPWFATEAEARLAMRWDACREMAETLLGLVEAEAKVIVREGVSD